MKRNGWLVGLFAMSAFCVLSSAVARTTEQNQTLGSAPDVYRIEIRNLTLFKVLETGDSDGTAELDRLVVTLSSYSGNIPPGNRVQADGYTEDQATIYNRTRNSGAGANPVEVKVDDFVTFAGRAVPQGTRDLWIHSRRTRLPTGGLVPVILRVSAHERDCTGNRKCGRGSSGNVWIEFNIPEFTVPPSTDCNASNTFKMQPVDDQLQIIGISGANVGSYAANTKRAFNLLTKHKKGGVRLMPFNADICIASTKLP